VKSLKLSLQKSHALVVALLFSNAVILTIQSGLSNIDSSELVLGLREPINNETRKLLENMGMEITGEISSLNVVRVIVPTRQSLMMEGMEEWLSYVEPVYAVSAEFTPNDPFFNLQWGLNKIQAPLAWDITTGSHNVLVVVIDTGISYNHPDLFSNYIPGGYDWVNLDVYPLDDNGHGSHCAGIVAATINNNLGIAGLAQVSLMAEKCIDATGAGSTWDAAQAIIHAVDFGKSNYDRVILLCGWGIYIDSSLIRDAIQYAYSRGCLIVASAGNLGTSLPHYPSGYVEAISVAATDIQDNLYIHNNFGKIDLSAPGVDIYSTLLGNSYGYHTGTSMAAAFTSGLAALVWSRYPEYSHDQVKSLLQSSSDDLGPPGWDEHFGHGRINALKALQPTPLLQSRPVGGEVLKVEKLHILFPHLHILLGLTILSILVSVRFSLGPRARKSSGNYIAENPNLRVRARPQLPL